jgi:predicted permease
MIALDVRYALRVLRSSPGFTAAAVLTLALGIGANTALFSVFDALFLKSLPVTDPERLVVFSTRHARGQDYEQSYPVFRELEARSTSLSGLAAATAGSDRMQVRLPPSPGGETAGLSMASGNFFDVLGVRPALGRLFTPADDDPQAAEPAAVLSGRYWQTRFAGSSSIVGQTIFVQGVPFTIVGVTPAGFSGHVVGESPDIYIPVTMQPRLSHRSFLESTSTDWIRLIGRLKPGVSHEQARLDLLATYAQIVADWKSTPKIKGLPLGVTLNAADGRRGYSGLRDRFETPLRILTGVVALVLLIACINVAGLLAARASSREREIAIRVAVGASRRHLARQFLVESLLLSLAGGVAGVLLGFWGTDALLPLLGDRSGTPTLAVRADLRLLAFTAAIAVIAGLLFGMMPLLRYARGAPAIGGRAPSARPRLALGRTLIVSQVALSLVLVVGAGLFVRTLHKLRALDAGFDRQRILLLRIDPYAAGYDEARRAVLNVQIREAIGAIPGVQATSQSGIGLMSGRSTTCCFAVPGYTPAQGERMAVRTNDVTADYFATVGMTLLAGRGFAAADSTARPRRVIVNQSFAARYFQGQPAVGQSFGFGKPSGMQVIGVVADAHYDGLREGSRPLIFFAAKDDAPLQSIEVRTAGAAAAIAAAVRRTLATIDPRLPLREMLTIEQLVDASLAQERLMARISGFFGVLALVLACVGIYGLLAQLVARRTQEIGIRMALGAERRQVVGIVLRETVLLVLPGVALGLAAAAVTTRVTSALLFGVTPHDPVALIAAPLCLVTAALLASWFPARRAATIAPLAALRHE